MKKTMTTNTILMIASVDITKNNACVLHVAGIANGFSQLGYKVTLLAPSPRAQHEISLPIQNDIQLLYFSNHIKNIPNALKLLLSIPLVIRQLKEKPDLFYTRYTLLNPIILLLGRLFGVKTMTEHNGLLGEEMVMQNHGGPFKRLLKKFADVTQAYDCHLAHHVRVVTDGIKQGLTRMKAPTEKIFVAGNGTDLSLFYPRNRSECMNELAINPNRNYIGFIGTLAYWQGVSYLIDAFMLIKDEFKDWDMIIAGNGVMLDELRQQAHQLSLQDRIVFIEDTPIRKAPILLNCFDIATSPALAQRNATIGVSSIKIRDYSASGCAILASHLPGNDNLENSKVIVCHIPENTDDIAQKLRTMINDSNLRQSLKNNAHNHAMENWGWINISRQCLEQARLPILK